MPLVPNATVTLLWALLAAFIATLPTPWFVVVDALGTINTPERIAGRWCLWHRATNSGADNIITYPPLIVCVGMAQTVQNWAHHLQKLSHDGGGTRRHVLLYQPAGLGRLEDGDDLAWAEKDVS